MNGKERLEDWKRKLIEINEKIGKLTKDRNILVNARNKLQERRNIKLINSLMGINLQEEISHLQDWIEFYKGKISGYENKIESLQKEVSQQEFEKVRKEAKLERLIAPIKEDGIKPEEKPSEEAKAEVKEELQKEILEQQLEDLDREYRETAKKEKKPLKDVIEEPDIVILSEDELKKDIEEAKAELEERAKVHEQVRELFVERQKKSISVRLKEKLKAIKNSINIKDNLERIRQPAGKITKNVFNNLPKLNKNKLIKYAVPVVMLLLVVSVLFLSKPEITGYVTITREKTYDDNLNLIINESGNYTWDIDKIGDISSIKASGRVKGNGTARVYIEKDGERILIYDNKKS